MRHVELLVIELGTVNTVNGNSKCGCGLEVKAQVVDISNNNIKYLII